MLEEGGRALAYSAREQFVEEPGCCFPGEPREAAGACCRCARGRRASPLACVAACSLVLTYSVLGGALFLALEGGAPAAAASVRPAPRATDLRARAVQRLWAITEDLNILYKENWTQLADRELMDFQRVLIKSVRGEPTFGGTVALENDDFRWTLSSSILYALTLITTIGHGNVSPKSPAGKMAAMAYACVGIPIVMLYLSTVGSALARRLRALYGRARGRAGAVPPPPPRTPFQAAMNLSALRPCRCRACAAHARVPLALSAGLLALYVALGGAVFRATEGWSLADGCYFSFSSLATVGFGDLRPGRRAARVSSAAEDAALAACCAYILVGVAYVAMCFDLIREDAGAALRRLAAPCARRRAARAAARAAERKAAAAES